MKTYLSDIKILAHGSGSNGTRLWHLFDAATLEKALAFRDGLAAQCSNAEIVMVARPEGLFTMRTILKKSVMLFLLLLVLVLNAHAALSPSQEQRLITAIRKVEGVRSRHPYGILSTHNKSKARRICVVTVRRLRSEWESSPASQRGVDWLDYLADGYCPSATDPVGNQNWKNNIHKLIK